MWLQDSIKWKTEPRDYHTRQSQEIVTSDPSWLARVSFCQLKIAGFWHLDSSSRRLRFLQILQVIDGTGSNQAANRAAGVDRYGNRPSGPKDKPGCLHETPWGVSR